MTTLVRVNPVIGDIGLERLDTLRGCHLVTDRSSVKRVDAAQPLEQAIAKALRELMLADRVTALSGNMKFLIQIEVL